MILITGGAGFIGSHVNLLLKEAGYQTIILDNLSRGSKKAILDNHFIQGDIRDKNILENIFSTYPIQSIMHFAALTDVGESMENPELYYDVNLQGTLNLIEFALKYQVKNFVFSSTASVYGVPKTPLLREDHELEPINVYGETKMKAEQALFKATQTSSLQAVILRYFNAAGGDSKGILKNYKCRENNLIPILLRASKEGKDIMVHGDDYPTLDGTCLRDYIHVQDLAKAHLLALQHPYSDTFNLGVGRGFSVKEVITATEKVIKQPISYKIGPRRPGDPPRLVADSTKAQEKLGWKPIYSMDIEKIVLDAHQALA